MLPDELDTRISAVDMQLHILLSPLKEVREMNRMATAVQIGICKAFGAK